MPDHMHIVTMASLEDDFSPDQGQGSLVRSAWKSRQRDHREQRPRGVTLGGKLEFPKSCSLMYLHAEPWPYTLWVAISLLLKKKTHISFLSLNLFIFNFSGHVYTTLFIYLWLRRVFVAARGLSLVVTTRDHSALLCVGFSLRWLLLLRSTGSR